MRVGDFVKFKHNTGSSFNHTGMVTDLSPSSAVAGRNDVEITRLTEPLLGCKWYAPPKDLFPIEINIEVKR